MYLSSGSRFTVGGIRIPYNKGKTLGSLGNGSFDVELRIHVSIKWSEFARSEC
jgi:hypothetical protein